MDNRTLTDYEDLECGCHKGCNACGWTILAKMTHTTYGCEANQGLHDDLEPEDIEYLDGWPQ